VLILGLDPGSLHTGFGVIERSGSTLRVLDVGRISCPPKAPLPERLALLVTRLDELIQKAQPEAAAIESPFVGLNNRSLIVLAQARGALLATLALRHVPIAEYSPAEVKSAITGSGRADKEQVAKMVQLLLGGSIRDGLRWSADASDALAVALCCAQRWRIDHISRG
jgi:crossover junction endodeoxyribonuclease RuvC